MCKEINIIDGLIAAGDKAVDKLTRYYLLSAYNSEGMLELVRYYWRHISSKVYAFDRAKGELYAYKVGDRHTGVCLFSVDTELNRFDEVS